MKVDRINNNYIGFANPELEKYIELNSTPELPILSKIYRETNIKMINPRMVSGHVQGLFLSFSLACYLVVYFISYYTLAK